MATWANNKCGYCGHTGVGLARYECPECRKTGCPTCMPEAGNSPCVNCVTNANFRAWSANAPHKFTLGTPIAR